MTSEHFEIDQSTQRLMRASPAICAGLGLLSTVLVFLDHFKDQPLVRGVGAVLVLIFGIGAWYFRRQIPSIDAAAVALDAEGIWQQCKGRDQGLIHWRDVAGVREQPALRRFELLARNGDLLLQLEYQLTRFRLLRALVLERAVLAPPSRSWGKTFTKGIGYHLRIMLMAALVVSLAGLFVAVFKKPVLAVILLGSGCFMAWRDYLDIVYKIRLCDGHLVLYRPGRRTVILREEIQAAELFEVYMGGRPRTEIQLSVLGRTDAFSLHGLGIQPFDLHRLILQWRSGAELTE